MISRTRLLASCGVVVCLLAVVFAAPACAATTAWSPVAVSGPTNLPPVQSETQRVVVEGEGGSFTLKFGASTTSAIPLNAEASLVEAELGGLASIGGAGGSVTVVGGPGGPTGGTPYAVTFGGSLANTDVAEMSANGSSLTGANHSATVFTAAPGGQGTSTIAVYVQNIGGLSSSGTITATVTLPSGVAMNGAAGGGVGGWSCTGSAPISCASNAVVAPGFVTLPLVIPVKAAVTFPATEQVEVVVSGGGAASSAPYLMDLSISSTPAEPGFQTFVAAAYDANGQPDHRAGGHPYSGSSAVFVTTYRNPFGAIVPVGEFKDIVVELPPGFLGNPISVPQCPEDEFEACPNDTIVGADVPAVGKTFGETIFEPTAIYDIEAPIGYPGKFYFDAGRPVAHVPIQAVGSLRSEEDYGLTVSSLGTPQIATIFGNFFTFWGVPGNSAHDEQRCGAMRNCHEPSDAGETAFLTSPTNCAEEAITPPATTLKVTTWQSPTVTHSAAAPVPSVTECENLHFEDDFTFEPSSTKADSTASFRTSLTVPSKGLTDPTKLTTPELKDVVVQLPKGVVLNASGADGLQACSEEQVGYLGGNFPMPNPMRFNKEPNTCPEASKIGTGELKTALLEEALHGALYLAAQDKGNPFGSLFAVYLVIEDPRHGIFIKLPGKVQPDEKTGQMTVTFENLPQLPFTRLDLNLKGGDRSALASPTTCGAYTTTATGTPWSAPESGPPTETGQSFEINEGPNGGACAKTPQERPFDIGWKAGAEKTGAGASGPFDFQITRPDGSQELETLQLNTPQGLSASLKGVPYCTEAEINQAKASTGKAEQEHPACPAASQVGTATTGAGSGPSPFYTSGKLYLAGPYKGAPISVVAVTPAVAGPFDLGNVVVRSAVFIDRSTAQVTAKTDPIPQILDGVVLRIKDVRIHLDRKDWTINPTSCEPSSVKLIAHGNSGAVAERSARFQVGGCSDLNFKPKLTGKVTGPTKRGELPAFTATLTYPEGPGYANIKDVQVSLPHSEFLEQAHINTICTRVQAAAHACPQGSIYGYAEATTPLIDGVLKGPVFLKSSVHKLPDLAIALKGPENQPVEVEFAGRIDSVHGQIRNTIEGLPDVPVSKFVLKMKGGKKGLLVNSRNLCQGTPGKMTVDMTAQNNKTSDSRPVLGNSCGKGKKGHKKAKRHQGHRRLSRLLVGW